MKDEEEYRSCGHIQWKCSVKFFVFLWTIILRMWLCLCVSVRVLMYVRIFVFISVYLCKMYEVRLVCGCGQKSGLKAPVTLFLMRTQVRANLCSSDIKSFLLVEHWLWTSIKLSVYTYMYIYSYMNLPLTQAGAMQIAEGIIKKMYRKLWENTFVGLFLSSSCALMISLTNGLPNPQFVSTSGALLPWPSPSVVTLQDWMGHD